MENFIAFKKENELIPAIIQESKTGEVFMLGFMNLEALQKTIKEKTVWFWSRSKKRLWKKGETSKNTLQVVEIFIDCDQDTLLVKVNLIGKNVCHSGSKTCFTMKLHEENI